jgi:hypothetical protein
MLYLLLLSHIVLVGMIPSKIIIKSGVIQATAKKLSADWQEVVNGMCLEGQYYETVRISKDVTRYYARCSFDEWIKEEISEVMKWLRKKLSKPEYTILREGSNFFDVIRTERLKEINEL